MRRGSETSSSSEIILEVPTELPATQAELEARIREMVPLKFIPLIRSIEPLLEFDQRESYKVLTADIRESGSPAERVTRFVSVVGAGPDGANRLLAALDRALVATAYLGALSVPGGLAPKATASNANYLDPAQGGVRAKDLWTDHGEGAGIQVFDIEQGWDFAHDELPHRIPLVGPNAGYFEHGTCSLLVLSSQYKARPRATCPKASPLCVSHATSNRHSAVGRGVLRALIQSRENDVLLVQAQHDSVPGTGYLPAEFDLWTYLTIKVATTLRRTVVEPAGNGRTNLDGVKDDSGALVFDPKVRNSGAILVGGHRMIPGIQEPLLICNQGRRVNVSAPAERVVLSMSSGVLKEFPGTSAAASIVAGIVACVLSDPRTVSGPRSDVLREAAAYVS